MRVLAVEALLGVGAADGNLWAPLYALNLPLAVLAQETSPVGDVPPLAGYGLLGALLAFVLWLFIDERKQHKELREKVLSDFLPALLANNEQMREAAAATVMVHQIAARPNLDPVQFSKWATNQERTAILLERVERKLDSRE